MNYKKLTSEVLVSLRGKYSQGQIAKKLNLESTMISSWERAHTDIGWTLFVQLCDLTKKDLKKSLAEAYSYYESDLTNLKKLLRHFMATTSRSEIAQALNVSPSTITRWLSGSTTPSLAEIFNLMDIISPDFGRFLHLLFKDISALNTIKNRIYQELEFSKCYYKFPWSSILLSAIEVASSKKNPSLDLLADLTGLKKKHITQTLKEFLRVGWIRKQSNGCYTSVQYRIAIRGSAEERKKAAIYAYSSTLNAAKASFGQPSSRFSWKMFSLNKKAYPLILQKYTEFFNELGTLIDNNQDDIDGVYLFSVGLIDMQDLAPSE